LNEISLFIAVFTTVRKHMALFIFKSSAIRSRIYWYILIGVSKELDASFFNVGEEAISFDIYLSLDSP
jgi:hypothetical protein